MKTQEIIKDLDGKPRIIKEFFWDKDELQIELNATQYECDLMCDDPKGDIIFRSYKPHEIKKFLEDFLQIINKGYEDIDLSISNYKNPEATFRLTIHEKEIVAWTTVDITKSDKYAEKIAKIEQIIKS